MKIEEKQKLRVNKEYILCSAIYYDDGKSHIHQPKNIKVGFVIAGRRHHNCIATLSILSDKRNKDFEHVQGFITNRDRFLDREESAHIAFYAGQIQKLKSELFSEDIVRS